ncbi:transcription termination factor 2 [Brachionichthys hirsutus]|uniref:transcription termination factor 2 n=1 Tax=Brachionichthys hirsutus TaxID=412623 RepID=UPI00360502B2
MEKTLCNVHGSVCVLKTGVKDGPNKGRSFYVCVDKQGCDFFQPASIPPSRCLYHDDSVVECQALGNTPQEQSHKLFFRCVVGKKEGRRWCGNVPWMAPGKEKSNPLRDTKLQPSCLPPVRNPFKVPGKIDEDLEGREMQGPGSNEENNSEKSPRVERRGSEWKENVAVEEMRKLKLPDTDRGKQRPPGMKFKKISDEERKSPKPDGEDNLMATVKDKRTPEDTENNVSTFMKKPVHPEKRDPRKDLSQRGRTGSEPTNPAVKETLTKCSPSSNVSKHTDNAGQHTSHNSTQPTESTRSQNYQEEEEEEEEDDDVVLVSATPATHKSSPSAAVQKTLTTFPGFQPSSKVKPQQEGCKGLLTAELQKKKSLLSTVNVAALPDKGKRLRTQVRELEDALDSLSLAATSQPGNSSCKSLSESQVSGGASQGSGRQGSSRQGSGRQGGAIMLPVPPDPGPSHHQAAFYGGRMTEGRLQAVRNATSEATDHLHKSLESCPDADAEAPDPEGIKVTLLAHQRTALAWLLWRETQNPCGGIFADDMGLGKTLTVISLILTKKNKAREENKKKEGKKSLNWISKSDSSLVVSDATLIVCPASLVYHWKSEIDRHVEAARLSVCLYHGPNREKRAEALAGHDVVVTSYSLVSREIPVQKEAAENPARDADAVPPRSAPLLRVSWARVVLDEAHSIKNPKAQTSAAVCRLRARARWAVTGTPVQNDLLDVYSLLKFLRCSPFDEYRLWKTQVDNGSKRGSERLNILTRSLLLRRTKGQLDPAGKPLVSLPDRTCVVHRVTLSRDEQAAYDVVFAQSRSTLQNYLKRHEGKAVSEGTASRPNPFEQVAQEFGVSQADCTTSSPQQVQKAASTVHILSLLLRLRQCCCHLSLLQKTLDPSELQGDGIVLSLEEQLGALSLASSPSPSGPDPEETVALNGTRFPSRLFEEASESTKISAVISELNAIKQKSSDQKSVIVSQWTSMLRIVAVHLQQMGLRYGVIDGAVSAKRRMDLVEEFNTDPKGAQVMLVSLCAGGVGLNLIGGNHLFLMDMHWNPALEDQACDRIYRVGQTKDVFIHRFQCEGTVEEKISTLQGKKKALARNVLSGTGSSSSKLSLADLRIIFGV